MNTISKKELLKILEKHKKWLNGEKDGERANLKDVDLSRFFSELNGVDLRGADLSFADLRHISLGNAHLIGADLEGANLRFADLTGVNLSNASLNWADLSYANLSNANLSRATLNNANLTCACLRNAVLTMASLEYANLRDAILDKKEQVRLGIILKKDMIAYKKCQGNLIVKLSIPKGSVVFSINKGKCRTNRAKVISISNIKNDKKYNRATSTCNCRFVYEVGKELEVKDFNLTYNVECGSGIHFFRTRKEAVEY
jgi:hypothetical protein